MLPAQIIYGCKRYDIKAIASAMLHSYNISKQKQQLNNYNISFWTQYCQLWCLFFAPAMQIVKTNVIIVIQEKVNSAHVQL